MMTITTNTPVKTNKPITSASIILWLRWVLGLVDESVSSSASFALLQLCLFEALRRYRRTPQRIVTTTNSK